LVCFVFAFFFVLSKLFTVLSLHSSFTAINYRPTAGQGSYLHERSRLGGKHSARQQPLIRDRDFLFSSRAIKIPSPRTFRARLSLRTARLHFSKECSAHCLASNKERVNCIHNCFRTLNCADLCAAEKKSRVNIKVNAFGFLYALALSIAHKTAKP
jgi:hypothetical protein